jgi:hypothetical protein
MGLARYPGRHFGNLISEFALPLVLALALVLNGFAFIVLEVLLEKRDFRRHQIPLQRLLPLLYLLLHVHLIFLIFFMLFIKTDTHTDNGDTHTHTRQMRFLHTHTQTNETYTHTQTNETHTHTHRDK